MRILVDLDGVLANWGAEYDRLLDLFDEAAAGIPRTANQVQWDLGHGRTAAEREIIHAVMTKPGFYRWLEPIRGAKEALNWAVEAGHDVRIVSTPDARNPTCASDKLAWVTQHYGVEWTKRLILTADKTVIHGDILIDDKSEITGSMEPTWEHVVFGDYAYNRKADRARMVAWSEFHLLVRALGINA